MDNRPIGIFDSGLGGLTGLMALRALLPEEDLIYFGDTGRMPYGGRPVSQLRQMARQNLDFMASFDVKAIFVACGTISSTASDLLESCPIPCFGVLRAGVEGMAQVPGEGPLAILATQASIDSGAFTRALAARCPGREILPIHCPAFVPLIESGHTAPGDMPLQDAVAEYLGPVKRAGAQAVLYGCTHYGIIDAAVRDFLGPDIRTVSASACAAAQLRDYLVCEGRTGGTGTERYYTTGYPAVFERAAVRLLGHPLGSAVGTVPVWPAV
jgi:glutamate racemase